MAVYTQIGAEQVSTMLRGYDVGELIALKGIAEGIQNSNFFVETTHSRFILTLYETRVNPDDLPFFYALLDHLHRAGCKVPRFIPDRKGDWLQTVAGRPACLIEFLSGVSVTVPTPQQAHATGSALAQMHAALADFQAERPNSLGLEAWRPLADSCGEANLESISHGLAQRIADECSFLQSNWPTGLLKSIIHADLFPDNVLILGDTVSGLIDFYFACTGSRGYDVAVTHAAWSFSNDGHAFNAEVSAALLAGYHEIFPVDNATQEAFPILLRGACLRFLLTRCYDWINTPADALVSRKDPLAFLRRLDFYRDNVDSYIR